MANTSFIASEFTGLSSSYSLPNTCPVCGCSGPFAGRPSPGEFRLFECSGCKIVFLFPLPTEAKLAPFYDESYYGEARKKFVSPVEYGIALLNGRRWRKLRPLLSPGDRLLDIGCGRGTLLQLAHEAGFEAFGTERSLRVGHAVPGVLYHSLPECNFPEGYFQVVVLWHVLEHLPDPVRTLQEIHRVLKPGGWLSLAVPNYGGAQAQASGASWFHLDLPRHFWHFRLPHLQNLLISNGFQVATCTTLSLEYDWFGTLQSWMNRVFHDDNRLYAILKGARNIPVAEKLGKISAATLLAPPALCSVLVDAARKRGGTLILAVRKVAS